MRAGLIGGVVGGLTAVLVLKVLRLPNFEMAAIWVALLVPAVVVVFYLTVAVHEAGHLLAGASAGFRPCLLIIGPLKLERVSGRWRVGANRIAPVLGGLAAGVPSDSVDLRRRMIRLIAGGPLASLVTGVAGMGLLVFVKAPGARMTLSDQDAFAYVLLLAFTLISLLIAFVALIPTVTQGYSSDGGQILKFMRNGPEVEAEVALTAVSTSSLAGTRPRDWDPAILAQAMELPRSSTTAPLAALLAHMNALDRGDLEAARRQLDRTLASVEQLAAMWRSSVLLHAAQFAALYERDAVTARRYLDQAGPGALISESARALTEAAVLHAEGAPGVDERLARAEADLVNAIDKGSALMAADQIAALRRQRASPGSEPASAPPL